MFLPKRTAETKQKKNRKKVEQGNKKYWSGGIDDNSTNILTFTTLLFFRFDHL
jgi:hypothetical protein